MKTITIKAICGLQVTGADIGKAISEVDGVYSVLTTGLGELVVTIYWPGDPDRGSETYGSFATDEERLKWVDDCREVADAGWTLLQGAVYRLHRVTQPFDPNALWERSNDAMGVRHG